MFDMIFFFACTAGIFVALLCRYLYAKSLTGVTTGGNVGPSYWGSYSQGQPDTGATIQLPKAQGICPACQRRSLSIQCSHPFQ